MPTVPAGLSATVQDVVVPGEPTLQSGAGKQELALPLRSKVHLPAATAARAWVAAYTCLTEVPMALTVVSRDPEIMSGALCFTGTRVPVQNLFDYLEGSSSLEDFLLDFPSVSREAAVSVLEQARTRLFADAPAA